MKLITKTLALSILVALFAGCGGSKLEVKTGGTGSKSEAEKPVTPMAAQAAKGFNAALETFASHDRANDWTDATCTQLAKMFLDAADVQRSEMKRDFPQATYNAGLSYLRCNKDAEAKAQFDAALKMDDKFHRARVQLALFELREKGDSALESVMAQLTQAVQDAKFQNVEALVNLAALQMKRRNTNADSDGANDFDRAKKNLQRALAIDDGYQPAFNQLALYYFEMAKQKAGRGGRGRMATFSKSRRTDQQMLELAALVCSQAIRKNPNYAAIHNTAGLIQVELQNINSAVQEFMAATKLDPTFFEAQMNYAAVNLSFRGFDAAEKAYRAALKIRPNDYDAHLGLALAIRGQINDSNFDQRIKEAQAELDACKKLAPERAETYYNEGILTHEFKAKSGDSKVALASLKSAAEIYNVFMQKAGSSEEFKVAVKRAKDRMQDATDMMKFIEEGQTQKQIEESERQKDEGRPSDEEESPGEATGGEGAAPAEGAAPPEGAPAQ